jgi:uncharacterized protein (TIGR02145 family)
MKSLLRNMVFVLGLIPMCSLGQNGAPCPDQPEFDYGGQKYHTVLIGKQCWMKENLNIGKMIMSKPTSNNPESSDNGVIEKFCFNNDAEQCHLFGGLYDWNEMMQYLRKEGQSGICPEGWHIPTDKEWCTLLMEFDSSAKCFNTFDYISDIAGGRMKVKDNKYWEAPNTGASNSLGFSALGSGVRNFNGSFSYPKTMAAFWTSTETHASYGIGYTIGNDDAKVHRGNNSKASGFNVRCIRNE